MADTESTVDNQDEAIKPFEKVQQWLDAISLASTEEHDWREAAKDVLKRFKSEKKNASHRPAFNILYSNVQTMGPALYNSLPTPDIRRRYDVAEPPALPPEVAQQNPEAAQAHQQAAAQAKQMNEAAKKVSMALERTISAQMDFYDFNATMQAAVDCMLKPGRGVTRVRYEPYIVGEQVADERVKCEEVQWDDFRRGPAKCWYDVPWVAFRHYLSREELRKLNPELGGSIPLDSMVDGADKLEKSDQPRDQLRRAEVWEVWDKRTRTQIFIAKSWPTEPIREEKDPLELEHFFPIPRPLYRIEQSDTLIPIEEYRMYKEQADELEKVSVRIISLIKVAKWRGIYDQGIGDIVQKMSDLTDGDLAPTDRPTSDINLDKAVWLWPVDKVVQVLETLYKNRDSIKQTIYEITGVADILRGATNASETATAQSIKNQWGSIRLSWSQGAVQRYARDLIRIMAEIIATRFQPQTIMLASGMQLSEAEIALMKQDVLRDYRIDIETDSTIRADVERTMRDQSEFVQSFSSLIQVIGPLVQEGAMPKPVAVTLLQAVANQSKLPRSVQEAFDQWLGEAQKPEPPKEDPKLAVEKARLEFDQQRAQVEDAREDQRMQREEAQANAEAGRKAQEHELKLEGLRAKTQAEVITSQASIAESEASAEHAAQERQANWQAGEAERATKAGEGQVVSQMQQLLAQQAQLNQQTQQAFAQMMQQMALAVKALGAPKRIVRGLNGRVEGVESMPVQ